MEYRRVGEIPTLETRKLSHDSIDKKTRYKQIYEILKGGKELTAKEIAVEMCRRGYATTSERNTSGPRLTELSQTGIVEPVGKKKCSYSGKRVAVYKLLKEQTDIFDYL